MLEILKLLPLVLGAIATPYSAPTPHVAFKEALSYTIAVDPAREQRYDVRLEGLMYSGPVTFVMARHPEYDDRFWRYVTDLTVTVDGAPATVIREDSARWRVTAPRSGALRMSYHIVMPPPRPGVHPAWTAYVSSNAALVGGPHSFLYPENRNDLHLFVRLELPSDWVVATALKQTSGAAIRYYATTLFELIDSPILVGRLQRWSFDVDGVRHDIAYAPLPTASPFDTIAFVQSIRAMTREAVTMFGGMPYSGYHFLFRDGAYGGLEHAASVTLGAASSYLAENVM
ncbi:MAG: hypothetical protein ABIS27_06850, partial [Longimicrobiales bacterium]